MTQTEFIKKYCEKSDITEKKLNKLGQFAMPCDCESKDCRGWAMVSKENIKTHCDLYIKEY